MRASDKKASVRLATPVTLRFIDQVAQCVISPRLAQDLKRIFVLFDKIHAFCCATLQIANGNSLLEIRAWLAVRRALVNQ